MSPSSLPRLIPFVLLGLLSPEARARRVLVKVENKTPIAAVLSDSSKPDDKGKPADPGFDIRVTAKIEKMKQDGSVKSMKTIEMGTVEAGKTLEKRLRFPLIRNATVTATAYAKGAALGEVDKVTVQSFEKGPVNFVATLDNIDRIGNDVPPELREIFSEERFGKNIGFEKLSIEGALTSTFGALLVVTNPKPGEKQQILYRIPPAQFSCETKLDELQWPDDDAYTSVNISQEGHVKASVTIPVYGSIKYETAKSKIFAFNVAMKNVGKIAKVCDKWTVATGLQRLPEVDKTQIAKIQGEYPTAQVIYVDAIYVIKEGTFNSSTGEEVTGSGETSIASMVYAGGGWRIGTAQTQKQSYNGVVNISGSPVLLDARRDSKDVVLIHNPDGKQVFLDSAALNSMQIH